MEGRNVLLEPIQPQRLANSVRKHGGFCGVFPKESEKGPRLTGRLERALVDSVTPAMHPKDFQEKLMRGS